MNWQENLSDSTLDDMDIAIIRAAFNSLEPEMQQAVLQGTLKERQDWAYAQITADANVKRLQAALKTTQDWMTINPGKLPVWAQELKADAAAEDPLREVREEMGKLMDEKVSRTATQPAGFHRSTITGAQEAIERTRRSGETPEEVMRHTKHAYGCFQAADEDEPIFTLRAKDAFAPAVVAYWMMLVQNGTALVGMTDEEAAHFCEKIDDARHCIQAMVEWQRNNTHKIPD